MHKQDLIGKTFFGDWYVESEIGSGSYGTVYHVVQPDGTEAAMKWIGIPHENEKVPHGASNQQLKTRYNEQRNKIEREITAMKQLSGNSHIVDLKNYQIVPREDGIGWDIYILMEYLTCLTDRLNDMTISDAWQLGVDICTALVDCSKKNIVHRDIKPDNIFINDLGHYKLGDFGIARQLRSTRSSMTLGRGTPMYMAPEVIGCATYEPDTAGNGTAGAASGGQPAKYDYRADIYSLGIVLYELLNDQCLPFLTPESRFITSQEENAYEKRIRGESLPVPVLLKGRPKLQMAVLKACAPRPEDRFQDAEEMLSCLYQVPKAERSAGAVNTDSSAAPETGFNSYQETKWTDNGSMHGTKGRTQEFWHDNNQQYMQAMQTMETATTPGQLKEAAAILEELGDYRDSSIQREICLQRMRKMEDRLRLEAEKKRQQTEEQHKENDYQTAVKLSRSTADDSELIQADRIFERLGNYKDSRQKREEIAQRMKAINT